MATHRPDEAAAICADLQRESDFYTDNPRIDAGPDTCHDCGAPMPDDTDILCATCSYQSVGFNVGEAVIYRPHPAAPAEDGVVTGLSSDPSLVFVRYQRQHPGASGQATPVASLTHLNAKEA